MLSEYAKIQPEVQKEIKTQLDKFFQEKQKEQQFQISKIQNHTHNGTDTQKIEPSAITSFIPVTGVTNGVFAKNNLGNQSVNVQGRITYSPIGVYVPQLPIIYGFGVGVDSQFNGGNAPEGTMVFFNNGSTVNQLWVMADGTWRGADFPL